MNVARLQLRWVVWLMNVNVFARFVPIIVLMIPLYVTFRQMGLLNSICLSVMFICSVSTVVFNGNPLLRFDGYYILMDILEIPNLRQKSTEITKSGEMTSRLRRPFGSIRPRRVSRMAFGCSWISFNMKSSNPAFSAAAAR